MGYRSDVIFGVKKEHKDKIDTIIKENFTEDCWEVTNKRINDYEYIKGDWVIYSAKYLKWYDDYEEVRAINRIIDRIDHQSNSKECFMVCLGEDGEIHDDVGEWYDFVEHKYEIKLW